MLNEHTITFRKSRNKNNSTDIFNNISTFSHALPFEIIPKNGTSLPTSVNLGSTVTAYYTVTNNTNTLRNNCHVTYLPPNVSQTTTPATYANTCSSSFSLAPGGTCTLQLAISGAVDAKDADPHHHLFVCLPGDTLCAGTKCPLNISVSGATPPSQQYTITTIPSKKG